VAFPAQATWIALFALQLRGPFSFTVQTGLTPAPALWTA
jgi:hypothetical protein